MRGAGGGRSVTPLPAAVSYWEARYAAGERPWGDGPSELARLVVARLGSVSRRGEDAPFALLDVGCGYGRDSRYLASELGCAVVGVDPSPAAIAAARASRRRALDVSFVMGDAASFAAHSANVGSFAVAVCVQVYGLLGPSARREFVDALAALLRPGGLLFLCTLSPRDPQHYAVGRPVTGEQRSWIHRTYLHFCTAEELVGDFAEFEILDLEERAYQEAVADGTHHHASWFLEARRR
ncbi:MAG: methyltransferase domain-containing protein [Thermoleophilia bacterium]